MLLSQRAIDEFTRRELDSFEWIKKAKRESLERAIRDLGGRPNFKTDPWLHQLACHYIGACHKRFLFLLDMGAGKTKIHADLIQRFYDNGQLGRRRRALIWAPRLVNLISWREDLERHSNLEVEVIDVEDIEQKRYQLLNPRGQVTIVDAAGLQLALCEKGKRRKGMKWIKGLRPDEGLVSKAQSIYGYLGIDELHKLANTGSLWHRLVDDLSAGASRVYGTTGTIFGRSPEEAWGPFHLVDRGESLGETPALFLGALFNAKQHPFKGTVYEFEKRKTPLLNRMLNHRSIRYDEEEISDLPKRVYHPIRLTMAPEQEQHYLRAVEGLINHNGSPSELEAPWIRMRGICAGYLKWRDDLGEHLIRFKQNPKLDMLIRLVDEAAGAKVVICYMYTPTGQLICDRLKDEGIGFEWFYGGTKDKVASKRRFETDPKCVAFVMQCDAGGTGTDGLQKVARYEIMYESPSAPITRKQTEKRIHRPGMMDRAIYYDLAYNKTVDAGILTSLAEDLDLYDKVIKGGARGLLRG